MHEWTNYTEYLGPNKDGQMQKHMCKGEMLYQNVIRMSHAVSTTQKKKEYLTKEKRISHVVHVFPIFSYLFFYK